MIDENKAIDEDDLSFDCNVYFRTIVDPPYAFMELELENELGNAIAKFTEEGAELFIKYLQGKLEEFRTKLDENVDKGMRPGHGETKL